MTTKNTTAPADILAQIIREQVEELKIWRKQYPRAAYNIGEEARARVAGRTPQFHPPRAFI